MYPIEVGMVEQTCEDAKDEAWTKVNSMAHVVITARKLLSASETTIMELLFITSISQKGRDDVIKISTRGLLRGFLHA